MRTEWKTLGRSRSKELRRQVPIMQIHCRSQTIFERRENVMELLERLRKLRETIQQEGLKERIIEMEQEAFKFLVEFEGEISRERHKLTRDILSRLKIDYTST
jgi:hypothetical protein